jgi:serine/threonine protein kinase
MIVGQTLSHYHVLELLGAGGMGEVYKAEDLRLKRIVALKLLPLALTRNSEAKQRLVFEAQSASALDHPNICTIHEIDETPDGRLFIAMAYYDGETLRERIGHGPVTIDEAITLISQTVRGVAAAHDAGIVHRDIKPANIVITKRGEVKLLDFGIAKLSDQTALTKTGTTLGTIAYMAPEMIDGQGTGARGDVWALGVVLYEMLAGQLPYGGDNEVAIMKSITSGTATPLRSRRPEVPAAVDRIVTRALQKDPAARYASAREMLADLEACAPVRDVPIERSRGPSRRSLVAVLVVALVVASAGVGWLLYRGARVRAARQQALPELASLLRQEKFDAAFRVMRRVEPILSDDPEFARLRNELMVPLTVQTDPPGADLFIKGYNEVNAEWIPLGQSPLNGRGPNGYYRWKIVKPGYVTFEGAEAGSRADLRFVLTREGEAPEGMVKVPGRTVELAVGKTAALPDFWIDRFEVTNREYKKFVDSGGYRDPTLAEFRDQTGRPGPATWELGEYPDGQDDYPVQGIS